MLAAQEEARGGTRRRHACLCRQPAGRRAGSWGLSSATRRDREQTQSQPHGDTPGLGGRGAGDGLAAHQALRAPAWESTRRTLRWGVSAAATHVACPEPQLRLTCCSQRCRRRSPTLDPRGRGPAGQAVVPGAQPGCACFSRSGRGEGRARAAAELRVERAARLHAEGGLACVATEQWAHLAPDRWVSGCS